MTEEKHDELATLLREPRIVRAGGEEIAVTTVLMRNVPRLLAALRRFGDVTVSAETNIIELLATHAPALVEAVAAAIDRPAEWVGALPAHEVVPLAEAALEVNADFFFTTALPLLASGVQVGARRHNGSSPGATAATSSPGTH